jgi:hypothetical protein
MNFFYLPKTIALLNLNETVLLISKLEEYIKFVYIYIYSKFYYY